jgi:Protein of unknown function (DUF3352)
MAKIVRPENCVKMLFNLGAPDLLNLSPISHDSSSRQHPIQPFRPRTVAFWPFSHFGRILQLNRRVSRWPLIRQTRGLSMQKYFTAIFLAACFAPTLFAQTSSHPSAPKIFPDNTLAYIRIDDTRELQAKMAESSTGKMAADPQVAPLIGEFYRTFNESFVDVQREFGINVDEILSIPKGEMAVAVIPGKRVPVVVFLIEAGDELPALELIVARAEETIEKRGGFNEEKKVGNIKVVQWLHETREDRQFGYFVDSGCLVFCSNADVAEKYAKIWTGNGIDHKPLADNRRFTSILSRCVGLEGERPQISFYVDPFGLVKELNKNNPAALAIMPILTGFGLDGLQAVGGSAIIVPRGFDSLIHAHVLLDNPRRGVMDVIRPKTGDTSPPKWVSDDISSYFTANWKVLPTVNAIKEIYETFRGPDSFNEQVLKTMEKGLGVDVQKEILEQWDDRICSVQVVVPPARIDGVHRVFGFKIKNPTSFASTTLPKIYDRLQSKDKNWTTTSFGGVTMYVRTPNVSNRNPNIRQPEPSLTVLGDDLVVSESKRALEMVIEAFQNGDNLLSEALEYKLVRDQIKAQLGNSDSSVVLYQRPEEAFRMLYDMAADPANRDKLQEAQAKRPNPLAAALLKALESHQLPPFEILAKYLSPAGAYVTEEENGLHYTGFSMQRK